LGIFLNIRSSQILSFVKFTTTINHEELKTYSLKNLPSETVAYLHMIFWPYYNLKAEQAFSVFKMHISTRATKCLSTKNGVSSIFLRVHRSKNAIHKPTHTFGVKIINKKYVFNYYSGSSGGSLVATPDCKLQSWVQIQQSPQPTVDCQSLDGQPSGMALCCRLSSEGRQRRIYLKKTPKTIKEKNLSLFKSAVVG
jgi:hypothetical protein